MSRLADNDWSKGPLTVGWSRKGMNLKSISIRNFRDADNYYGTCLMIFFNRLAIQLNLPRIIKPYQRWVEASWDEETVKRLGRTGYWHQEPKEYGVCYLAGHLSIAYGRRSMDSRTEKRKGWFLPWTQWKHIRHSVYDLNGELFATIPDHRGPFGKIYWEVRELVLQRVPVRYFAFKDFDGEELMATTHIEEREWSFGGDWFSWLRFFRRNKIRRTLEINFSGETGSRKGSWKGGTIGHGIDLLPKELHQAAFERYCKAHDMTFLGEVPPVPAQQQEVKDNNDGVEIP